MLYCRWITRLIHRPSLLIPVRSFSSTWVRVKKAEQLPPRPTLPDSELQYVFLKGSGPGGQKINKTSSACQITHLPTGTVVKSQATRSKSQNYTNARRILAEKVEFLRKGDESRVVKQEEKAAKKKASADKKKRRKYKSPMDAQDHNAGPDEEAPGYFIESDAGSGTMGRDGTALHVRSD